MRRFGERVSARAAILAMIARVGLGTIGLAGVRGDAEAWGDVLLEAVPRKWRWFLVSLGVSVGSGGVAFKIWGHTMASWAWWELIFLAVLSTSTVSGAVMAVYQYRENNRGGAIRRLRRLYPQMDSLLESLEEEKKNHQNAPRSLRLRNRIRIQVINAALKREDIPTMGESVNRDGYRPWIDFLADLMAEVNRGDLEAVRSLRDRKARDLKNQLSALLPEIEALADGLAEEQKGDAPPSTVARNHATLQNVAAFLTASQIAVPQTRLPLADTARREWLTEWMTFVLNLVAKIRTGDYEALPTLRRDVRAALQQHHGSRNLENLLRHYREQLERE